MDIDSRLLLIIDCAAKALDQFARDARNGIEHIQESAREAPRVDPPGVNTQRTQIHVDHRIRVDGAAALAALQRDVEEMASMSNEAVDELLREQGVDPEALAARGLAFVHDEKAKVAQGCAPEDRPREEPIRTEFVEAIRTACDVLKSHEVAALEEIKATTPATCWVVRLTKSRSYIRMEEPTAVRHGHGTFATAERFVSEQAARGVAAEFGGEAVQVGILDGVVRRDANMAALEAKLVEREAENKRLHRRIEERAHLQRKTSDELGKTMRELLERARERDSLKALLAGCEARVSELVQANESAERMRSRAADERNEAREALARAELGIATVNENITRLRAQLRTKTTALENEREARETAADNAAANLAMKDAEIERLRAQLAAPPAAVREVPRDLGAQLLEREQRQREADYQAKVDALGASRGTMRFFAQEGRELDIEVSDEDGGGQ